VKSDTAWTQESLAEELHISLRAYKGWENAEAIPSPEYLKQIVDLLKLNKEDDDALYRAALQVPPIKDNLPPENPFFTGRETELEQLRKQLQETGTAAITQPVSISGLGGIGKTQLALAYANRFYSSAYRVALWVNAANKETLQTNFAELAEVLNLPERNEQILDRRIRAVMDWLKTHTNWLFIMDNADDLELARSFFPGGRHGHILLTTRSQFGGQIGARQLEINKMEREDGLIFLLRRSRFLAVDADPDTIADDIRKPARQLVELLDGHPLALDQAGAYIEETSESHANYINLYNKQRRLILDKYGALERKHREHPEFSQHPDNVVVTFELCFTKARELHPWADDILSFCAFLQPDAIPEELFRYDYRFQLDALIFNAGIAALQRFSLIKRNVQEKTFSMHRLVQAVRIDKMSPKVQNDMRYRVVSVLDGAFPKPDFTKWARCERLLPHALFCATWTEDELASTVGGVWRLLQNAGRYLHARGQFSEAETLLARVLMYHQHFGVEDHLLVSALSELAVLFYDQGKYGQAEPLFHQALAILEKQLGAEDPDIATSLHNLAYIYLAQEKDDQAEQLLARALSIHEKQLGAEHRATATSLHALGDLYSHQGKYDQAEQLLARALSIHEKQLGAEHRATATSLGKLASIYHEQNKYEQAESLYRRALRILDKQLGAEHPDIVIPLYELAILMQEQGKSEQAEELYKRALITYEQILGETHPHIRAIKMSYVDFLHSIGRDAEAAALGASDDLSV